jgi:dolichol-phosphate mannosyltransferase
VLSTNPAILLLSGNTLRFIDIEEFARGSEGAVVTTTSRQKLGLVIPTLNEAGNIVVLLGRLHNVLTRAAMDYEILVVDDDSEDGTADLVRQYGQENPRVRVFVRHRQRGLAGAVLYGWQQTDANLLGVMDADLQHPPELLPSLLVCVAEHADIAIASRYANGNGAKEWNRLRRLISQFGTMAAVPLQRKELRVKDPLSGFFVVRREAIEGLSLQPEGFKILLEILVKGRIQHAVEIPFHFGVRHAGKSKADIKVALQYFTLLGKLSRYALFGSEQQ